MLIFTINVILGICLGLYLKNIALFLIISYFLIYFFYKKILCKLIIHIEYKEKLLKYDKAILFGIFICVFFYFYAIFTDYQYISIKEGNYQGSAKVVSFKVEKKYKNKYIVKTLKSSSLLNGKKFIIYLDKSIKLNYGDIIYFNGTIEKVSGRRNSKGVDYARNLRQSKIYGILNIEKCIKVNEERNFFVSLYKYKYKLETDLFKIFSRDKAGFLNGILLGDKNYISEEINESFKNSNLSHIIAISGMHVVYVNLRCRIYFKKNHKK